MKLYYTPGSSSLASRIVACEAGLDLVYDKVDLKNRTTASGRDFSKINPKGYVPALALNDGQVLTETSVVIQFLADQAPQTRLMPELGSLERYRVQEWIGFISTELHKGFAPLWKPTSTEAARQMAVEQLHRRFGYVDRHLEGRSYLMGELFTVADAYGYAVLNWTSFHKIDVSPYSRLLAYMRRVAERPRVRQALEAEGLLRLAAA
ncbi:glutathione transferase GstA [Microvirga lenta]|uniref:glutathione transferase GstA n=1 Tax=Microvirga lenta TaxID=2881337 RepID=UPI001D00056F|nr:glutathione transferase GstA [Microvirga lenta]MCB5176169.1 glutathione transferase GstA [Microvirga lenta]